MRALCVRVILGSATHYSNPGWVALCEEWICQCVHLCICVRFPVLVRDSELPTIHPIASKYDVANSSTASLRCSVAMTNCKATINLSNRHICGGNKNQSKCSFSIGHLQCCTWILERMSIQNAMVLESLESNAKLHHLALPTMLSALKHDREILALFIVVNWSQPNHTRLAV